ncbi:hypothetical protein L195_g007035, partial [Trifolium pratense]
MEQSQTQSYYVNLLGIGLVVLAWVLEVCSSQDL